MRIVSVALLAGFAAYFTRDLVTFRTVLLHPDFYTYYYAFRHWFASRLAQGDFPLWNPYWGLGHPAEAWSTIPLDLFTPLELVFGPRYNVFQTLQALGVLGAAAWSLRRLGAAPLVAASGATLFFLSPWVSYFFHYFIVPLSYAAHALLFLFLHRWLQTRDRRHLFFIAWITALSMLGTKLEYWFFQSVHFAVLAAGAAALVSAGRLRPTVSAAVPAVGAMALGILVHAWQLTLLLPVMARSGRAVDHGLASLVGGRLYRSLAASLLESVVLQVAVVALVLFLAVGARRKRAAILVTLAAGLAILFSQPGWLDSLPGHHRFHPETWVTRDGTFAGLLAGFVRGPALPGALVGLGLTLAVLRDFSWRRHARTSMLFLVFVYYYCREGPGDIGEMDVLRSAPAAFRLALGAFVWLGLGQIAASRPAQLACVSIVAVLVMRDQGQIVLAHLTGWLWIPTRDSYIVDFALTVLAAVGLTSLAEAPAGAGGRRAWRRALPGGLAVAAVIATLASTSASPHYVHPLMGPAPPGYPYFEGVENVRALFRGLRTEPATRVFLANDDFMEFHHGMGASVLEGLGQVTLYASLIDSRFRDWANFHALGIRPEQRWRGYSNETAHGTMARLPRTSTLGRSNTEIYRHTVIARPPLDRDLLSLLGVRDVLRLYPVEGPYAVEDRTPAGIDEEIGRLAPARVRRITGRTLTEHSRPMYLAELASPLPRAFFLSGVPHDGRAALEAEMSPRVEPGAIRTASGRFPLGPAAITRYEPERVTVTVDAGTDGVLVLSDLHHPSWEARVDGQPAEVFPALYLFRGVRVRAGRHQVDFVYRVPFLRLATTLSLALLAASVIGYLRLRAAPPSRAPR